MSSGSYKVRGRRKLEHDPEFERFKKELNLTPVAETYHDTTGRVPGAYERAKEVKEVRRAVLGHNEPASHYGHSSIKPHPDSSYRVPPRDANIVIKGGHGGSVVVEHRQHFGAYHGATSYTLTPKESAVLEHIREGIHNALLNYRLHGVPPIGQIKELLKRAKKEGVDIYLDGTEEGIRASEVLKKHRKRKSRE